jgi:malonate-semialdehyde dehydrogenase (acetylating)/methylmalonate-semialdehyde dehydrogenase
MAGSVMVAIAETDEIVKRLVEGARALVPGRDYGPVISRSAKERIERAITEAEAEGANILVDGRGLSVPGSEDGFFVGPTIIDGVRPEMQIAQVEVFGPVLAIIRVDTMADALALEARSPYGNAASVFTSSAASAERVVEAASAGMIGVNLGVPVPREPFGFGGWNASRYGVGDITGRSSIEFWTQSKKVTTTWPEESR